MDWFPFRCARSFSFTLFSYTVCVHQMTIFTEKNIVDKNNCWLNGIQKALETHTHAHSHQTTTTDDGRNIDFEKYWKLLNIAKFELITAEAFSLSLSLPAKHKGNDHMFRCNCRHFAVLLSILHVIFVLVVVVVFEPQFLYYIDEHCITFLAKTKYANQIEFTCKYQNPKICVLCMRWEFECERDMGFTWNKNIFAHQSR